MKQNLIPWSYSWSKSNFSTFSFGFIISSTFTLCFGLLNISASSSTGDILLKNCAVKLVFLMLLEYHLIELHVSVLHAFLHLLVMCIMLKFSNNRKQFNIKVQRTMQISKRNFTKTKIYDCEFTLHWHFGVNFLAK